MAYIAGLDYEHLDKGIFLTALARSISKQNADGLRVLVHGDSAYTDRIMQTGVMREDAKVRSIQDLNHRLIALLADEGVSAVGINGFQRKTIIQNEGEISVDANFLKGLPDGPVLVISTLIWDEATDSPQPVTLPRLISYLGGELGIQSVFAFSSNEKDEIIINNKPGKLNWDDLPDGFADQNLPEEFHQFNEPLQLATARDFSQISSNNSFVLLR